MNVHHTDAAEATADAATKGRARDRLIEDHLPLVRCLARRHALRREDLEDLVQAGAIGLVQAANRYDPSRASFAAYAAPMIVGEIRRYLRDRATVVRLPRRIQAERRTLRRAQRELTGTLGREPTRTELAERVHTSVEDVDMALASDHVRTPLQVADGVADAAIEVACHDVWGDADDQIAVQMALGYLGERDRRLVTRRFFDDLSQQEIAREIGVSQVQVSRLLRAALDKLQRDLDDRLVVGPTARA
jgi:RNA polymerase sigma-B factor